MVGVRRERPRRWRSVWKPWAFVAGSTVIIFWVWTPSSEISGEPKHDHKVGQSDPPCCPPVAVSKTWRRSKTRARYPTIDVISIGSEKRVEYQQVQQATIGRHPAIRHWHAIDELHDTEATCHDHLTLSHVETIVKRHCKNMTRLEGIPQHELLKVMPRFYAGFPWLTRTKPFPPGWMCAQKRPVDAIVHVLSPYYARNELPDLPDYLIVMDDDTWINLDQWLASIQSSTSSRPTVTAGCLIRWPVPLVHMTFPFGGWSTIFSRASLQRWLQPIDCTNRTLAEFDDHFVFNACRRIRDNAIGEALYFRNGMSTLELMQAYTFANAYQNVDNWNHVGSCLHSDWHLGYWTNYYQLADHSQLPFLHAVDVDRIVGYRQSEIYSGGVRRPEHLRECWHDNDTKCGANSTFCHYISPARMRQLHAAALQSTGQSSPNDH